MSVAFDKRREMYVVRVTVNGARKYVGQFDTHEAARRAELAAKPSELSKQKVHYVEDDVSFIWLANFRRWIYKRNKAKLAKKILED